MPSPRRRYRLTGPTYLYIFLTLLVALGAFNSQNNLLFWAFGVALSMLVVSGLVSGRMMTHLRVRRLDPEPATAGRPGVIRYEITNTRRRAPAFALTIEEVSPAPAGGRLITAPLGFVRFIPPESSVICEARLGALRRGVVSLDAIRIRSTFPFGIIAKSIVFRQPGRMIVRPAPSAIDADAALRTAQATRAGQMSSLDRIGAGDGFYALREYTPGDPLRQIAWRAAARRDELLVRQNTAPSPTRVVLVVPHPAEGPAAADALEASLSGAAGLATAWSRRGIEVGLSVPWQRIWTPPAHGARQLGMLLDAMARVDLAGLPAAGAPQSRSRAPASYVVVHAGGINNSQGPPGAVHVLAPPVAAAGGAAA